MLDILPQPAHERRTGFFLCCCSATHNDLKDRSGELRADLNGENGDAFAIADQVGCVTNKRLEWRPLEELQKGPTATRRGQILHSAEPHHTPPLISKAADNDQPPAAREDPKVRSSVTLKDGSVFTGELTEGLLHGDGTYTWAHGESYTGQWENHLQHGRGVLTWPNGQAYTGQFEAGKRHGTGFLTWPDGRKYAGTWRQGQRRGPWEFFPARHAPGAEPSRGTWGDSDEPDPSIGLPPVHGDEGTRSWRDGSTYTGQINAGEPHGFGTAVWPNSSSFSGQYRFGQRSGAGVQSWPNSSQRFVGQWRDGARQGCWELTQADGEVRRGSLSTDASSALSKPSGDAPRKA